MNVDFLQVSFDVIPRITAMVRGRVDLPGQIEMTGWLVTLWFDEVAKLNERDTGPVYRDQQELIGSLFREVCETQEEAERAFGALVDFGFIEQTTTENVVRLRGMSRYFELAAMREDRRTAAKRAGKASGKSRTKSTSNEANDRSTSVRTPVQNKTNARSNTRSPETERSVEPSEVKLSEVKSSEVKRSEVKRSDIKSLPPSEKPKSAARQLSDALCEEFQKARRVAYRFSSADGVQLSALREIAKDDEILRRWRIGLGAKGWLETNTIAQLASKWNDLSSPRAQGAPNDGDIIGHGEIIATIGAL